MTRRRWTFALAAALLSACGRKRDVLPPNVPPNAVLARFAQAVDAQARANRVPPGLIYAIIAVESGGNPRATGSGGARGLMQLKPATAAAYGITDLYDPVANITAGARLLGDLMGRFHGDLPLVVAAYNAGPLAVLRAQGVPAAQRGYVDRVLAIYNALPR